MDLKGWEPIYKDKGMVQFEILNKVRSAVEFFKERNYVRVLDLGCGTGRHSLFLAQNGFEVFASDVSPMGIKIALQNAKNAKLENINFLTHDMREIPFKENFFHAVICTLAIDHGTIADVQQTINEVYRVLKNEGAFIVDFMSIEDETYGKGIKIEENTFKSSMEGEENIIHHYASEEELKRLFAKFNNFTIQANDYQYKNDQRKLHTIKTLDVKAIK